MESKPKATTQAEVRPIWGGFMGSATNQAQRTAAEPSRPPQTAAHDQPRTPMQSPAGQPQRRVGVMHPFAHPETHPGSLTVRLNSRAVATFAGFAAVGAFVLIVFLGSTVGLGPSAALANESAWTTDPRTSAAEEAVTWSGGTALTSLSVGEYGEQVAIATLTASLHEVSTNSVTFFADPNRSGNALQQFAEVFGEAIATGRNPLHEADNAASRKETGR